MSAQKAVINILMPDTNLRDKQKFAKKKKGLFFNLQAK
jgi:hypothetical protein